jgi:hypothetical protein
MPLIAAIRALKIGRRAKRYNDRREPWCRPVLFESEAGKILLPARGTANASDLPRMPIVK